MAMRGGRTPERFSWIAANAGHEGSIVCTRVKDMKADEGFNAQTEQVRGSRQPFRMQPSIASLLLRTEAAISQIPELRQQSAMSAGGMAGSM